MITLQWKERQSSQMWTFYEKTEAERKQARPQLQFAMEMFLRGDVSLLSVGRTQKPQCPE